MESSILHTYTHTYTHTHSSSLTLRPPLFHLSNRTYKMNISPKSLSVSCNAHKNEVEMKEKETKLWGGRFEEGVTDAVERFTESISFDKALYKQDIMGSRAHASMLAHQVFV